MDNDMIPKLICQFINRLFLKIPPTTGPKTRIEAAKPWRDILQDQGLPIEYDEQCEMFVVREDENTDKVDSGDNGELSADDAALIPVEEAVGPA